MFIFMHTHCTYEYVEYDDEDILFKDDEALSRMAHGQLITHLRIIIPSSTNITLALCSSILSSTLVNKISVKYVSLLYSTVAGIGLLITGNKE